MAAVNGSLSATEALVAIASHAVFADGMVTAEEQEDLCGYLASVPGLGDPGTVEQALRHVSQRIRGDGEESVLAAAIRATPAAWRPRVYAVAARLIRSDGDTSTQDSELLHRLRDEFGLPHAEAQRLERDGPS
jgi:tellurite resistance protein